MLASLDGQRLEALLDRLPMRPGIYRMLDRHGRVIYIGKAKNLRSRVRSYFRSSGEERGFVSQLPGLLGNIEVVVTASEKDALILEREQIGRHHPRFNINLRDNKNFLSILISSDRPYARMVLNRRPPKGCADGQWFGPYTSAARVRETFRLVQATHQLRICSNAVFARRTRPCLQHQMGRCLGPCALDVPAELYKRRMASAVRVLRGRLDELVVELERQMKVAASQLRYEDAARLRDRIQAVRYTLERQEVIDETRKDRDVLGLYREGASGVVLLMQVRQGCWLGASRHPFRQVESSSVDVLRQFISQHYGSGADLPAEILLPDEMAADPERDELSVIQEWLSEKKGARVRLGLPRRGKGAKLLRLAGENAQQAFRAQLATASILSDRLERLRVRLDLSRIPRRIDCVDLSTLGGRFSVGSLAVLIDGEPAPGSYRHFRIREAAPDSDVDMMREVVKRRFRPVLEGSQAGPDLLVLDGGLGQLRTIEALFADLGVTDVDLVALAKGRSSPDRRERVFIPGRKNPIVLGPDSDELFLLARVRDEAHRLAVSYHRKLRRKTGLKSILEEIPGIGPVIRRRLLTRFRSLRVLGEASLSDLSGVAGVSGALAERILSFIQASVTLDPRQRS